MRDVREGLLGKREGRRRHAAWGRRRHAAGGTLLIIIGLLAMAPAALGARAVPAKVPYTKIVRNGPFVLSASELASFPRGRVDDVDEYEATPGRICRVLSQCTYRLPSGAADPFAVNADEPQSAPLTSDLVVPFLKHPIGVSDPQIAVGPDYIVTTQRNVFGIYDKSGTPVTQTINGMQATYEPDLCDLFAPLLQSLNANADLPGGSTGITVANGDGFDCVGQRGQTFYDARMVWDDFRHRYWIAALAINQKVSSAISSLKHAGKPVPPVLLGARRGKFVVAVSQTADPRDGWNEYWFDANVGDGQCNPKCTAENGTDYPFVGMSHHFFLWESVAGEEAPDDHAYRNVAVINADWLANASSCSYECGWDFHDFDVNPHGENVDPVVDHTVAPDHTALFVSPRGGDRIRVWTLSVSSGQPSWTTTDLDVIPFFGPNSVDQPKTYDNPNPSQLTWGNAGNDIMRAVYRDGRLLLTFAECVAWPGTNSCTTSVRLIELRYTASGWVVHRDRTIGKDSPDDPPGTIAGYAYPEVEINKDGNVVVDFVRSGKTVLPEARYSTFLANQGPVVASALINAGNSNINGSNPGGNFGNVDTGGISVDGSNDGGVWMMDAYAHDSGFALGVAKVFGAPHPDLILSGINLAALKAILGGSGAMKYQFVVAVRNQGDGKSDATTGTVTSVANGKNPAVHVHFKVPALRSGRSVHIPILIRTPAGLSLSQLRIAILPDRRHREYSTANNVAVRPVGPAPSFSFTPTSPLTAAAVSFDASASSDLTARIASYAWSFGDGSVATGKTASHAFSTPGAHTVTLTVTDRSGLTRSVSEMVRVAAQLPDLAVQAIDSVTSGSSVTATCVVTYTLANVGAGPAGPSTTHVVFAQTDGTASESQDASSAGLAAEATRNEQVTFLPVRGSCTTGVTVTVTANSTGSVAEADAGHDTNNTLSRSF